MCDVVITFPWRSCRGFCGFHALFSRWHVVGVLHVGFFLPTAYGRILALKGGLITLSVDSVVPNSRTRESIVMSDPTARALLAFLCRGCSPQDRVFWISFWKTVIRSRHSSSCSWILVLLTCSLGRGGATFHFARCWSVDLTTLCGRWALATTVCKYISRAACDTLHWVWSCGVHKTGPASSGCASLFVPSLLLCGLALPMLVPVLWLVRPVTLRFFLVCLLMLPVPEVVHGQCGFHGRCVRQISHEGHNQDAPYPGQPTWV